MSPLMILAVATTYALPPNTSSERCERLTGLSDSFCSYHQDGRLRSIEAKPAFLGTGINDCDLATLDAVLEEAKGYYFSDGHLGQMENFTFVKKKTLEFSAMRVCRFAVMLNGVEVGDSPVSFGIDNDGDVVNFVFDPPSFDASAFVMNFSIDELLGAASEDLALTFEGQVVRRLVDGKVRIVKRAGEWRVVLSGLALVESGMEAGYLENYAFEYDSASGEFLGLRRTDGEAYEWTCPQDTVSTNVRHDYCDGEEVSSMSIVHPSKNYTGNYELVDYCGAHVYNCVDYSCEISCCPFMSTKRYNVPSYYFNDFSVTEMSDPEKYALQNAYYFGEALRDYFSQRTYIDTGSYEHKFNVIGYCSGTSSYSIGIQDCYMFPESNGLRGLKMSHGATSGTYFHEYWHVLNVVVAPYGRSYGSGIDLEAFNESMGDTISIFCLAQSHPTTTYGSAGWPNYHFSEGTRVCEVPNENPANCKCANPDYCVDGPFSAIDGNEYKFGGAFRQALNEIKFNRSYSSTNCTSDLHCVCHPYLAPSWCLDGQCDTGAVSGYCYSPIGTYSVGQVEEALWYALQTMPQTIEDSDVLAYHFMVYLYAASGYQSGIVSRMEHEFKKHNIDPL